MNEIKIFDNSTDLDRAMAEKFRQYALKAQSETRNFSVALCGGKTPYGVYTQLAKPEFRTSVPWEVVHLFWGDERCVSPDHVESNYKMVCEALIDFIPIPGENIHRIRGEGNPELEANRYGEEIRDHFIVDIEIVPKFDWVLLGLGTDGHTASLFSKKDIFSLGKNVCSVTTHPQTGQKRITLTLPIINQAFLITFLCKGPSKVGVIADIIGETAHGKNYPATCVHSEFGKLQWWLDHEAARLLKK